MFKIRVVEKALDELSSRTVIKPDTVRSVLCLIDLNILNEPNLNAYIEDLFEIKKNKIVTVYYASKRSKELTSYSPLFCNRHLHWDGTLIHPMKKKIMSKKYDLLFNFFVKDNRTLQSISSHVKADFRVGFATVDHRLNDLMLGNENNSAEQFFNTFNNFFFKISTE